MRHVNLTFWGLFLVLTAFWAFTDPLVFWPASIFALRGSLVQLSGVLAMACMSAAMILALRPQWPEQWFGGLDKMYRLHKWLGIGGLVLAIFHWLWAQGPKWAAGLGLLSPPQRGPRAAADNVIQQYLGSWRGLAEGVGEWAFYAAVLLIAVALIHRIPYRLFYQTHKLLAVAYLVLVFHSIVLLNFSSWATPLGIIMGAMMLYGTYAAIVVLIRRVGATRKTSGTIASLHHYPKLGVIEGEIDIPSGWPGHKAGQFAFVTSDRAEGAHPYTIASAWNPEQPRLTLITKGLGDWTRHLHEKLRVGQAIQVEGPYGCFTFDDDSPRQIWIGGGIGITPFIARMKQLAAERRDAPVTVSSQPIDLFHTTADYDDEAIAKLRADADAAGVSLHVLHDSKDGQLSGERIRDTVPDWRHASVWFCGPVSFSTALKADFKSKGMKVEKRFHQELFAMR